MTTTLPSVELSTLTEIGASTLGTVMVELTSLVVPFPSSYTTVTLCVPGARSSIGITTGLSVTFVTLYTLPSTITVTFPPVVFSGSSITRPVPLVLISMAFDTVNVAVVVALLYLSSPAYVTIAVYVPSLSPLTVTVATPSVRLA